MLRKIAYLTLTLALALPLLLVFKPSPRFEPTETASGNLVPLPEPRLSGGMSVEEAIAKRRSIRSYRDEPLTLEQLSQLLWSAQGITSSKGYRSAPSAGATYPYEVYVVVGEVIGLEPGVYRYLPEKHALELIRPGDYRMELQEACLDQEWVGSAPIDIVLVAFYERTTGVYGERGIRYVHMEAGHIGQNIYLQATALGLGTVAVGAFHDGEVASLIRAKGVPLYVFPVGVPNG